MYREHELVVLLHDLPRHGLTTGDVGTVVGTYGSGGYEVEFATGSGRTLAVVTLDERALRTRSDAEILHIRALE